MLKLLKLHTQSYIYIYIYIYSISRIIRLIKYLINFIYLYLTCLINYIYPTNKNKIYYFKNKIYVRS